MTVLAWIKPADEMPPDKVGILLRRAATKGGLIGGGTATLLRATNQAASRCVGVWNRHHRQRHAHDTATPQSQSQLHDPTQWPPKSARVYLLWQ